MKSISPRKEKNENMPSMCISSEGREVKSVFLSYQTNQGQAESNKESQNPDLIRCNSDLANSFQILRTKTIGMGHPGHYFQKALNSVTQKSRSQSLPSCLESKKVTSAPVNESDKEVEAPSKPHESNEVSVITVKVNNVTNETWFRTWPERGNDKLVTPHNNNVNGCHLDSRLEKSGCEGPEDCSGCSCLGKEHQTIKEKVIVNHSDNICKKLTKAIGFSPEKSFKLDECALKTNPNESIQTVGLQRNDLLTNCDTENYSNIQHSSPLKSLYSLDSDCINSGKAPIPLTELLQNIPLAYSPVTRQLHIISSNHTVIDDEDSEDSKKKLQVHQNGLKQPLESIEEEGLVDGCQSLTKCSEDDSVSFESPRSTLQRFGASSLSRTDASSFSSIVSSLSDASPSSTNDEPDDSVLTLHGSPSESSDCYDEEIGGTKSKRKGLSSFFSRNVFAWKTSRDAQNNNSSSSNSCSSSGGSTPGWKLFGRLASKPLEQESATILEPGQLPDSPASIRSTGSGNKRYEDIIASSSALILHNRPSSLPAKSLDEEQKHRLEYQQMVEAARKKEMKEAKLRKKQLQRQLKVEEQLANAARIWNNEILPKWEMMKTSRKARDLWWQGIPPSVRGKVWKLAIGNELNVTHDLYNICLSRAQERLKDVGEATTTQIGDNVDKEASMELIQLDIARTFPHLCIFQRGGPYYDILHCLLGAYVCYRPDVGYVQGMSFIAAVLILNLEAPDAFICFSNLLNRPCHMAFFCLNQKLMSAYYAAYNEFFRENLPRLYTHFTESSLSADLYLLDWLYTVFAKAMPLDVACRVWDVFLRDGEEFLFKAALGVLHLNQEVLLKLDFIHGAQFLTKLPDDLAADQLFKSIETIHMNVGKQRFSEVLAYHIDKCQQEQR